MTKAAELDADPLSVISGLGLVPGVQIPSVEGMMDVFFASMSGRVVPFDDGSFNRWGPQREARRGEPTAVFARQLVEREIVPTASSPITGVSLADLFVHGTAWTVSTAEGLATDPLRGLAVLVISEIGITIAQLAGAYRSTAVIAVKYRLRKRWGIPLDWVPPEDRAFESRSAEGRLPEPERGPGPPQLGEGSPEDEPPGGD